MTVISYVLIGLVGVLTLAAITLLIVTKIKENKKKKNDSSY